MRKWVLLACMSVAVAACTDGDDLQKTDAAPPRLDTAPATDVVVSDAPRDTTDATTDRTPDTTDMNAATDRVDSPPSDAKLDTGAVDGPTDAMAEAPRDGGVDGSDGPVVDAAGDVPDVSAADAPDTAGTDIGTDSGTDSGTDAGTDSGTDAGTDSGTDAGTDVV